MVRCARALDDGGYEARLVPDRARRAPDRAPAKEVAEVQKLVVDAMTHAMELSVPLEVQAASGDNWLEVHG
jgi:DNA polymerase I-like protein with 3'-5' exonuclease and polymerase domains